VAAPIPAADLGTGNWVHLVGTYDGGSWNLYRNGVLIGASGDSTGSLIVSNANWAIGARGRWKYAAGYPTGGLERQFTGAIDEVAIYNYALTLTRVQTHYAESIQPLSLTRSGVTWVLGTLMQSTNILGPYTTNNSTPPIPIIPTHRQEFFRVKY